MLQVENISFSYRKGRKAVSYTHLLGNPDSLISVKDICRILTGDAKQWKDIYPASRLGEMCIRDRYWHEVERRIRCEGFTAYQVVTNSECVSVLCQE